MKNFAKVSVFLISVISLIVSLYLLFERNGGAVVYYDSEEVFKNFEMTKELKLEYEKVYNHRKQIIDSLELDLRLLSNNVSKGTIGREILEYKGSEYETRKQMFEEDNAGLSAKYDQQIWSRITQYSKEFGEKYGYSCILGANGNGVLMYGDEKNNITDQFIKYINEHYRGGGKK